MKTITIVERCMYSHPDGKIERLDPGTYDLPDEMADHWFIQVHSDNPPKVQPSPGTPEYAYAEHRRRQRQELLAAHAAELEAVKEDQRVEPLRRRRG